MCFVFLGLCCLDCDSLACVICVLFLDRSSGVHGGCIGAYNSEMAFCCWNITFLRRSVCSLLKLEEFKCGRRMLRKGVDGEVRASCNYMRFFILLNLR